MKSIALEFTDEEYDILKDGCRIYKQSVEELIKETVMDSLEDRFEDDVDY